MTTGSIAWPRHWRVAPLWSMFRRVKDVGHPGEEMLSVYREHGVVRKDSRDDNFNKTAEDRNIYQLIHPGWLIVNRMKAWQGSLGVSPYRGIVSGHYICFEPTHGEDHRFLNYLLRSPLYTTLLLQMSRGVRPNQIEIDNDALRTLPVRLPPLAEQRAIADYLDAETARIDALIAKKQQLIHLLDERFAAEREQLLTRPEGEPLVRSRTGYFESVPVRWHETTLRHLGVEVQTGPFGSQLHAEEYVEGGWPVVNPANIRGGRIRQIDAMTVSDQKREELSRHVLRKGDIVFGRRGEMGRAGLVGEAESGWLCGTGSLRLRVTARKLDPEYLAELLQTDALRNYFLLTSVGSTMDNLNSDIVLGMPCLVPELAQQRAIVELVRQSRMAFDLTRDRLSRQIDLLTAHRQALITHAVKGRAAGEVSESIGGNPALRISRWGDGVEE